MTPQKKEYQARYYKKNKKRLQKYKDQYYKKYKDKLMKYARKARKIYLANPSNRIRFLLYGASKRALTKNFKCDIMGLTVKFLNSIPKKCACCSAKLDYRTGHGRIKRAPSFDRLDSRKGYTLENTFVICDHCNRIKNNGTAKEHQIIAKYMISKGS